MYLILALGLLSFVFSLLLTPLIRDVFRKIGVVDTPDRTRKLHVGPIPRVGGIAIAISYVAALAVAFLLPISDRSALSQGLPAALSLLPAAGVVFLTGLLDDLLKLKPWQKLAGQVVAALMAYGAGVQVHLFRHQPLDIWWSVPISVIWLVGCTNAFNLIDGLDGLATGVGLFATATVLAAALTVHNLGLVIVTVPLLGCLLGFLRYNFNPASIFLGDCGSLLIGFLLGCFGTLWGQKSTTLVGMTAPLMALAIPLLDVALSIMRRFLRHQPIFGADRGHIHHMLLLRGLTPRRAALSMYAICGIASALSLLQHALDREYGGLIILVFCGAAWIGIQHLGYVEFGFARNLLFGGTFRRIINAQTKLVHFEEQLSAVKSMQQCWEVLVQGCHEFGFEPAEMQINGKVFQCEGDPARNNLLWQVHIPLPNSGYVNVFRDLRAQPDALLVDAFIEVVHRVVGELFPSNRVGVVRFDTPEAYDTSPVRARGAVTGKD